MNFKTTYVLFGVLAVVLAVFGITQFAGVRKPADKTAYVLPSLNDKKSPIRADDIETVVLERTFPKSETLVFKRTEQGWRLEKPDVRVQDWMVDRIISELTNARRDDKADISESKHQLGLDAPRVTVTLIKKGGGPEYKLTVGNESPGKENTVTYVLSSDRKEPAAVKTNDLGTLTKPLAEFRTKDLMTVSSLNAQALTLQLPGKDAVELKKEDAKWKFVKPAYGDAEGEGESPGAPPADAQKVSSVKDLAEMLNRVKVKEASDFVAEDVSDADLQQYGLEKGKPATLRVEAVRNVGGLMGGDKDKPPVTETLLVGKKVEPKKEEKKDGDKKDEKKEEKKEEMYYARLEGERAVVQVPVKEIEPLLQVAAAPEVLRNRDLIQVDAGKVDAINIQTAAGLLKLRGGSLAEGWKMYAAGAAPRQADRQSVNDLLAALNAKRQVKSFPPTGKSDADLGFDKPTAEVSVWIDGIKKEEDKKEEKKDEKDADKKDEKKEEKKEEKKDAEPTLKSDKAAIKLTFGKKEDGVVYVRREAGDDKARLAVPETLLARVQEGPLAYLDKTLPSFPVDTDPVKLTITRGGETFEVEHEKKDDKLPATWKLTQPKHLAGRAASVQAVEMALAALRSLHTDKLVAEKPPDADLQKYELKTPPLKAVVTFKNKDGKAEERTYLFGRDTDDKAGRYAKQGERDVVFVVRSGAVAPLQAELQDPTVLTFDPAKVKGMKLTGWQNVVGTPITLELERKSAAEWSAKQPAGFQPNPSQTEIFLGGLNGLKATRFVVRQTGPKSEHKLEVKDGALQIEITVEGEKEPLRLTIGGLIAADKAYFASGSRLPGDVFLLPEERFKKVLEAPAYFKAETK